MRERGNTVVGMNPRAQANAALVFFSLALVVLLLVEGGLRRRDKTRRILLEATGVQSLALLAYSVAGVASLMLGNGTAATLLVQTAAILVAGCFDALTSIFIIRYMSHDIIDKPLLPRPDHLVARLLQLFCVVNLFLVVFTPAVLLVYGSDSEVWHVSGLLFMLREYVFLAQALLMMALVLRAHGQLQGLSMARNLCGSVLVIIAVLCERQAPGLIARAPTVSLILVLLTVGVQERIESDLAQSRAQEAETRVRLLTGQIQPHFIFNSLAAIKELIAEDQQQAEATLLDFSDYLRSHLDVMSDMQLVPLPVELDHVRHYVALEQADCLVPLEVRYELEETDFLIPPLTIQPLVENAIRYAIRTREQGGSVTVRTWRGDGSYVVQVADDGSGISSATALQNRHKHVGLENVRERIERQCKGSLVVESTTGGTTATIFLPESQVRE